MDLSCSHVRPARALRMFRRSFGCVLDVGDMIAEGEVSVKSYAEGF